MRAALDAGSVVGERGGGLRARPDDASAQIGDNVVVGLQAQDRLGSLLVGHEPLEDRVLPFEAWCE